jgi:hypothetical protein
LRRERVLQRKGRAPIRKERTPMRERRDGKVKSSASERCVAAPARIAGARSRGLCAAITSLGSIATTWRSLGSYDPAPAPTLTTVRASPRAARIRARKRGSSRRKRAYSRPMASYLMSFTARRLLGPAEQIPPSPPAGPSGSSGASRGCAGATAPRPLPVCRCARERARAQGRSRSDAHEGADDALHPRTQLRRHRLHVAERLRDAKTRERLSRRAEGRSVARRTHGTWRVS